MKISASALDVALADGRRIIVPIDFYPTLKNSTPAQRSHWQILGWGEGVEWPELDLQLSVESIVAGRREHVPPEGFSRWLNAARGTSI